MSYLRVCPRDLFNESKLLKCIGKISLYILDNYFYPIEIREEIENPEEGFKIEKSLSSGDLFISNYHVYVKKEEITLVSLLNSKQEYPLIYIPNTEEDEMFVFNQDGYPSTEFLENLKRLNR